MSDLPRLELEETVLPNQTEAVAVAMLEDQFSKKTGGLYLGLFLRRAPTSDQPVWEIYKPGDSADDFPHGDGWEFLEAINMNAFMSAGEVIASLEMLREEEKLLPGKLTGVGSDPKLN
jgi:hypothetical protein